MDISELDDRVVRVTFKGRLDTQGVGDVESRFLASLVEGTAHAIVNLSDVEFVASMGIRMLVSAAQRLRKRQAALALYGAPERVNQVFGVVSLQKIIPVCGTEAEALAAVTRSPA